MSKENKINNIELSIQKNQLKINKLHFINEELVKQKLKLQGSIILKPEEQSLIDKKKFELRFSDSFK